MDDIYATELLGQNLTDTLEREDNLKQSLEAAETQMQSLQNHALSYKKKYQQLDSLLEAEEAKTHAERLAKQAAEEKMRQHRAEVAKLRINGTIANQHCEAAESEIISLQKDLSTERSAAVTASTLTTRLREELRQAEANGMAAYDMLNDARAKICALEQDLKIAIDCISMLELGAREHEERVEKEHRRVTEAEKTLSATASEIKNTELKFSDLLEKYNALEAEHSKCHPADADSVTVSNLNNASMMADDTQSPISIPNADTPNSKHARDPDRSIPKNNEETSTINPTSRTAANNQALSPPQRELPTFPSPAILRPRLASATSCHVEILKATGRIIPVTPATDTKNLRWKFLWRLPGELLRLLIRDSEWR